ESTYTLAFKGELGQEGKAPFDEHYAVAGQVFTWAPSSDILDVGKTPKGIAISSDGSRLYVGCQTDDTVQVWDTETGTKLAAIPVGNGPNFLAFEPQGRYLYVSNEWGRTVGVIDTLDLSVSTITGLATMPEELEVTPDGARLYVTTWTSDPLFRVMVDPVTGAPLSDTATRLYIAGVNSNGQGLAIDPSLPRLFLTYQAYWWYPHSVGVVDISGTEVLERNVDYHTMNWGCAASSDGQYVYYGAGDSRSGFSLRVLDVAGGYVEAAWHPQTDVPWRLASDGQGRVYSMMAGSGKVEVYHDGVFLGFINTNATDPGCRPTDATVTAGGDLLYVTCSNINQVRRFSLSDMAPAGEQLLAMTAVAESAVRDDSATLVLSGISGEARAYVDEGYPVDWDADPELGIVTLRGIAPGSHTVQVMSPGYEVLWLAVDLAPYEVTEIPVSLTPSAE
ncbi:MAG: beta-propeller fold lactonase family protein, partial [bacterium]|nr:beta-propeller fold lactonase family protein [bacterium]